MTHPNFHLVMPMGGAGTRFQGVGYPCPKPLLPLRGKPFFYWAVESIRPMASAITFVVLKEHVDRFGLREEIKTYYPEADIVVLDHVLAGAVLTCLEGVKGLPKDTPVLFNDCDHFFRTTDAPWPKEADGLLLTFSSDEPKYSFLDYDPEGNVRRTVEKQVISHDAICGAYYFRTVALFEQYARRYLEHCTYSEFYLSGVYNELIAGGGLVRALPTALHIPFGTPEEYAAAQGHPGLVVP